MNELVVEIFARAEAYAYAAGVVDHRPECGGMVIELDISAEPRSDVIRGNHEGGVEAQHLEDTEADFLHDGMALGVLAAQLLGDNRVFADGRVERGLFAEAALSLDLNGALSDPFHVALADGLRAGRQPMIAQSPGDPRALCRLRDKLIEGPTDVGRGDQVEVANDLVLVGNRLHVDENVLAFWIGEIHLLRIRARSRWTVAHRELPLVDSGTPSLYAQPRPKALTVWRIQYQPGSARAAAGRVSAGNKTHSQIKALF